MGRTTEARVRYTEHVAYPVEAATIVAWFYQGDFLAVRSATDESVPMVQRTILAEYPVVERVSIPVGFEVPSHAPWATDDRIHARRIAESVFRRRDSRAVFRTIRRMTSDRLDDRPVRHAAALVASTAPAPEKAGPRLNWLVWDLRDSESRGRRVHAANALDARQAYRDLLGLPEGTLLGARFIPKREGR